ncbi:MAG: O-antigen ligase family protein [Actinomycetota bacterium]|nr:O-antigen ligase family protein [Actinomycetota bacterium]
MIQAADSGVVAVEQDTTPSERAATGAAESSQLHALLLLAALAGALVSQGAYYRQAQGPVMVLLAGALIAALRADPLSVADLRFAPLAGCAALAGWVTVRAAAAGDVVDGIGAVALIAGVVTTVIVARRTSDVEAIGAGAVGLGVLTALTGWIGVAWRISPWALKDQGLWRAATSVTYANAGAAVLGALTLVAIARLVARPGSRATALSVCMLLTGLGATLSRGGLLAAAVGALALAALLGIGAVARAVLAPAVGAAIALAGLVPSISAGSRPRPVIALVALLGGLALAGSLLSAAHLRRVFVLVTLSIVAGVAFASADGWHSAAAVRERRLTAASPDRTNAVRAALRLVDQHPLVGVGPGRARLSWTTRDGTTLVARYAHNEYLQVLLELGAVGLVLLLAVLIAVARSVRHGRVHHIAVPLWAGATAGLVALAVGSGLDFLWHVPAVPLVAGLLFGITVPKTKESKDP